MPMFSPGPESPLLPKTEDFEAGQERGRERLKQRVFEAERPDLGEVRQKALAELSAPVSTGFAGTGVGAAGPAYAGQQELDYLRVSQQAFYDFLSGIEGPQGAMLAISQQDAYTNLQSAIDEAIDEATRRSAASNPFRQLLFFGGRDPLLEGLE